MTRRSLLPSLSLVLLALIALAGPVAAKDGMEARLDTPLSVDAEPGSTIEVGVEVSVPGPSARFVVQGTPIFVRLLPPGGGESTEARAHETPAGSGQYVAAVEVPAGGIDAIEVGIPGEQCDASGCRRSDVLAVVVGDVFAGGVAPAVPVATAPAPDPATATSAAQPTDAGVDPRPFVVAGVAILALAAITGWMVRRRAETAGRPV
jgi:hypothetical protein